MKDFRELKVWQKAHQLTLAVYRITTDFPRQEVVRTDLTASPIVLVDFSQFG
jgi:hypothetical protein